MMVCTLETEMHKEIGEKKKFEETPKSKVPPPPSNNKRRSKQKEEDQIKTEAKQATKTCLKTNQQQLCVFSTSSSSIFSFCAFRSSFPFSF